MFGYEDELQDEVRGLKNDKRELAELALKLWQAIDGMHAAHMDYLFMPDEMFDMKKKIDSITGKKYESDSYLK